MIFRRSTMPLKQLIDSLSSITPF